MGEIFGHLPVCPLARASASAGFGWRTEDRKICHPTLKDWSNASERVNGLKGSNFYELRREATYPTKHSGVSETLGEYKMAFSGTPAVEKTPGP